MVQRNIKLDLAIICRVRLSKNDAFAERQRLSYFDASFGVLQVSRGFQPSKIHSSIFSSMSKKEDSIFAPPNSAKTEER